MATPCCSRNVFELPLDDRLTLERRLVDCAGVVLDELGPALTPAQWESVRVLPRRRVFDHERD